MYSILPHPPPPPSPPSKSEAEGEKNTWLTVRKTRGWPEAEVDSKQWLIKSEWMKLCAKCMADEVLANNLRISTLKDLWCVGIRWLKGQWLKIAKLKKMWRSWFILFFGGETLLCRWHAKILTMYSTFICDCATILVTLSFNLWHQWHGDKAGKA